MDKPGKGDLLLTLYSLFKMTIERFEQLTVWQLAHQLVLSVYRITNKLPSDE